MSLSRLSGHDNTSFNVVAFIREQQFKLVVRGHDRRAVRGYSASGTRSRSHAIRLVAKPVRQIVAGWSVNTCNVLPFFLFVVSVGLPARMCGGECGDFHVFIENALYGWMSIEIAAIKHLRTRHMWDQADVG